MLTGQQGKKSTTMLKHRYNHELRGGDLFIQLNCKNIFHKSSDLIIPATNAVEMHEKYFL